jgi:selenocysteine lyase/cysteine desulfurase
MDVAALRADTPGCETVVHFNNAGSSLPPRPVVEAQTSWIAEEARLGGYEMAERHQTRIEGVYGSIARMIGAEPGEIALLESATVAWWQAFHSLDLHGKTILTSEVDYGSNFVAYLQAARRTGSRVEVVPSDASGQIAVDELERRIDDSVGLIAVTHMPTNGGLINPADEIGAVARAAGVPFLLDACQTVGQIPIDVEALGCDFLSATGRKYLRGPRGTGFLYVSRRRLESSEPALLDAHGATMHGSDDFHVRPDARRFEMFEASYAARAALGTAVDYARAVGLEAIGDRIAGLASTLRSRLGERGARIHDLGARRGGIVTFTMDGVDARNVKHRLGARSINVSVVRPSSTPVDSERRDLPEMVRASVHYYNTEEEIDLLVSSLAEDVRKR